MNGAFEFRGVLSWRVSVSHLSISLFTANLPVHFDNEYGKICGDSRVVCKRDHHTCAYVKQCKESCRSLTQVLGHYLVELAVACT